MNEGYRRFTSSFLKRNLLVNNFYLLANGFYSFTNDFLLLVNG